MSVLFLASAMLGPALAGDFDTLRVAASSNFTKMIAGPGISGAVLSPDGSRLLHVSGKHVCVYDLAAAPKQLGCTNVEHATSPQDAFWSPDNAHILWPLFDDAMLRFRDTDIQVLDAGSLVLTNLTDDGTGASIVRGGPANFEMTAQWLDNDTIAFVRIALGAGGMQSREPASLMSVQVSGGEPKTLVPALGDSLIYGLEARADGALAYIVANKDPAIGGVFLIAPGTQEPLKLAAADAFQDLPSGLAFSADGRTLMAAGWDRDGKMIADLIDVTSGAVTPLFKPEQSIAGAAWSPTGLAVAYVVRSDGGGQPSGLYLAEPPTAPGRLLETGPFMTSVCCQLPMMTWAANDTMVLGNMDKMDQPFLIRFQR